MKILDGLKHGQELYDFWSQYPTSTLLKAPLIHPLLYHLSACKKSSKLILKFPLLVLFIVDRLHFTILTKQNF